MKRYIFCYLVLILFLFYTNGFYTYIYYEKENVKEDFGEFRVGKYPYLYESVFLVTVDDISYYTDVEQLEDFLLSMNEREVAPTLFVIPYHAGKNVTENTELIQILAKYEVEVAQHGYRHTEKEFKSKSYDQQIEMITEGRAVLEENFTVYGFRAPGFYHNFETSKALRDLGFSYESEMSVFDRFYTHYLLQIPHKRGGRVFMTHDLGTEIPLPERSWTPTMKEFTDWWMFRSGLDLSSWTDGEDLYIVLSEYREGLRITLEEDYEVHIICGEGVPYERVGNTIIL